MEGGSLQGAGPIGVNGEIELPGGGPGGVHGLVGGEADGVPSPNTSAAGVGGAVCVLWHAWPWRMASGVLGRLNAPAVVCEDELEVSLPPCSP